jgi:hypothetical protein
MPLQKLNLKQKDVVVRILNLAQKHQERMSKNEE